jgi:hypothetical protein
MPQVVRPTLIGGCGYAIASNLELRPIVRSLLAGVYAAGHSL